MANRRTLPVSTVSFRERYVSLKVIASSILIGILVLAFVAAPHSCDWGLTAYVLGGVGGAVGLVSLPVMLRRNEPAGRRVLAGAGLASLGIAVWIAGLFLANVRIMCRLF